MEKNIAVIDLGTNTFHLLIVRLGPSTELGFETVYRERVYVKLAEEGIEKIGKAAFNRGMKALKQFRKMLDKFETTEVAAIGTAALRTASNGAAFIQEALQHTRIDIQLINGDREADLIGKGVSLALPALGNEKILIMDIGGGSVEFIIKDCDQVYWSESFPIGVAILFKKFNFLGPLKDGEALPLQTFLRDRLSKLLPKLNEFKVDKLVGASGTFDVLDRFMSPLKGSDNYSEFKIKDFYPTYNQLLQTSLEERLADPRIPKARAEMLIVALIMIKEVIAFSKVPSLIVSSFALKEGVISEQL